MKCDQTAEIFFEKAQKCFSQKNYDEALKNFNQTLRLSVNGSPLVSQTFYEKAKIYFDTKNYQFCLDNIQKAIEMCANDVKCESYKKLQDDCSKVANETSNEKYDSELLKLSYPAHKKVPFIAECLEVLENDIYGRFIATTRDLKPGDIVVLEEPFYKVLDPEQRHVRCAVCLKQNMLSLFPCSSCSKGL